jgi:hypothetical protein
VSRDARPVVIALTSEEVEGIRQAWVVVDDVLRLTHREDLKHLNEIFNGIVTKVEARDSDVALAFLKRWIDGEEPS